MFEAFSRPWGKIAIIFLAFAYAITRYIVYGDANYQQAPLFIANKALAFLAILSLGTGSYFLHSGNKITGIWYNQLSLVCAVWHTLISLLIISPSYYSAFYTDNVFSSKASFALQFGIFSLLTYGLLHSRSISTHNINILSILCASFLGLHIYLISSNTWGETSLWFGNMPPISLICFIYITAYLIKQIGLRFRATRHLK